MASKGRIEGVVYDEHADDAGKYLTSNIDVSKRYRELLAADARRWHGMRGGRILSKNYAFAARYGREEPTEPPDTGRIPPQPKATGFRKAEDPPETGGIVKRLIYEALFWLDEWLGCRIHCICIFRCRVEARWPELE